MNARLLEEAFDSGGHGNSEAVGKGSGVNSNFPWPRSAGNFSLFRFPKCDAEGDGVLLPQSGQVSIGDLGGYVVYASVNWGGLGSSPP